MPPRPLLNAARHAPLARQSGPYPLLTDAQKQMSMHCNGLHPRPHRCSSPSGPRQECHCSVFEAEPHQGVLLDAQPQQGAAKNPTLSEAWSRLKTRDGERRTMHCRRRPRGRLFGRMATRRGTVCQRAARGLLEIADARRRQAGRMRPRDRFSDPPVASLTLLGACHWKCRRRRIEPRLRLL